MGIKIRMVLAVLGLVCVLAAPAWADVLVDDFKGGINTGLWTVLAEPEGAVTASPDGVVMEAYPNYSGRIWFGVGLTSKDICFSGDFDVMVDFELLDWPAGNDLMGGFGIEGAGPSPTVRLAGQGMGEAYVSNFPNGLRYVSTTDTAGTLRLARQGSTLTGYYFDSDGNWQIINESPILTVDTNMIWVVVWSAGPTLGGTMRFSNLYVSADRIFNCGQPVTPVNIDIKPGSSDNPINVKSKGVIPVAVLGSVELDATTIDAATLAFGPAGAVDAHGAGHIQDVNGDGLMDVLFHFYSDLSGIACGDTSATLTGATTAGQAITGTDAIVTKGCK